MGIGSCARSARRRPAQEHRPATTAEAAKRITASFEREGGIELPAERIPARTNGAKTRPPKADRLVKKNRRRRMGIDRGVLGLQGLVENSNFWFLEEQFVRDRGAEL